MTMDRPMRTEAEYEAALAEVRRLEALCCANIAPMATCPPVEASPNPDGGWHAKACHPVQHVANGGAEWRHCRPVGSVAPSFHASIWEAHAIQVQ
jgi:hypothetical protein